MQRAAPLRQVRPFLMGGNKNGPFFVIELNAFLPYNSYLRVRTGSSDRGGPRCFCSKAKMVIEPCLHLCGWLKNRFSPPLTCFSLGHINSGNRKVSVLPRPPAAPTGRIAPCPCLPPTFPDHGQHVQDHPGGWGRGGRGTPGNPPSPAAQPRLSEPPWCQEGRPLAESQHVVPWLPTHLE